MIRKATHSDIGPVLKITLACANHMKQNGIHQWDDEYPNRTAFEKDVFRNELYIIEKSDQIIGCVVISDLMDDEYEPIVWLTPNGNSIYIHRLAIHPEFQGKGYAQKLMDFAENLSRESQKASVRLDTFSRNERNQKFYEQRGYQKLGDVYFPNQSTFPFHCYELIL